LVHELLIGKPPFRAKEQMQTYNLILRGIDCIQLSHKIPKKAQVLIKRLCRQAGSERIGVQKNGIGDIKAHQWFAGFQWDRLEARKMMAPLTLPVRNNTDMSNFDDYPDNEHDEPPDDLSGWDDDFWFVLFFMMIQTNFSVLTYDLMHLRSIFIQLQSWWIKNHI
jgi:hypothetical protein